MWGSGVQDRLARACVHGDAAGVRAAVEAGAGVHVFGQDGFAAVHTAVKHGHAEVLRVLLACGGDPASETQDAEVKPGWVGGGGKNPSGIGSLAGHSALHLAALYGARDDVVDMLACHAPTLLRARSRHEGWTPLHCAAFAGRLSATRVLLAHGADVDALAFDNRTPLILAAQTAQASVVHGLLAAGANVAYEDDEGSTALHHALDVRTQALLGGCLPLSADQYDIAYMLVLAGAAGAGADGSVGPVPVPEVGGAEALAYLPPAWQVVFAFVREHREALARVGAPQPSRQGSPAGTRGRHYSPGQPHLSASPLRGALVGRSPSPARYRTTNASTPAVISAYSTFAKNMFSPVAPPAEGFVGGRTVPAVGGSGLSSPPPPPPPLPGVSLRDLVNMSEAAFHTHLGLPADRAAAFKAAVGDVWGEYTRAYADGLAPTGGGVGGGATSPARGGLLFGLLGGGASRNATPSPAPARPSLSPRAASAAASASPARRVPASPLARMAGKLGFGAASPPQSPRSPVHLHAPGGGGGATRLSPSLSPMAWRSGSGMAGSRSFQVPTDTLSPGTVPENHPAVVPPLSPRALPSPTSPLRRTGSPSPSTLRRRRGVGASPLSHAHGTAGPFRSTSRSPPRSWSPHGGRGGWFGGVGSFFGIGSPPRSARAYGATSMYTSADHPYTARTSAYAYAPSYPPYGVSRFDRWRWRLQRRLRPFGYLVAAGGLLAAGVYAERYLSLMTSAIPDPFADGGTELLVQAASHAYAAGCVVTTVLLEAAWWTAGWAVYVLLRLLGVDPSRMGGGEAEVAE